MGYRNVAFNLRLRTAAARELGVDTHVCEVQLLLRPFAELKVVPNQHPPHTRTHAHARAHTPTHCVCVCVCAGVCVCVCVCVEYWRGPYVPLKHSMHTGTTHHQVSGRRHATSSVGSGRFAQLHLYCGGGILPEV